MRAKVIWAIARFQFEGFHHYPGAPEGVEFLSHTHRHIFHCEVRVEQKHNNRDVEFITLKRQMERIVVDKTQYDNKSCEMIAEQLTDVLESLYPDRDTKVFVFEDNENGGLVEGSVL